MADYDGDRFQPPAPVARVVIRHGVDPRDVQDVPMLIDTGADVTLIPRYVAAALMLETLPTGYELVGFDGQGGSADVVLAALVLDGRTYRGQFLVIDQEWGIPGRNILNTFILTLDGPRRATVPPDWR